MGIYSKLIVPRLIQLAMRNHLLEPYRERVIGAARGRVLEIGVGSGSNLPLYGRAVDRVYGLDPSAELLRLASMRAANVPVSLTRASAEQLPFGDAEFDTSVMTWTLCSVPNPVRALTEIRRVLKPGGRLLFVEHGLSPEPRIIRWQHWLTPCWKRIGGGCHLDRKKDDLIRAAGFRVDAIETGYMSGDVYVSGFGNEIGTCGHDRHLQASTAERTNLRCAGRRGFRPESQRPPSGIAIACVGSN